MKIHFGIALSLFIASISDATTQQPGPTNTENVKLEFKPSSKPVRIKSLWPEFMAAKIAIEPAIPKDFVLLNHPDGNLAFDFFWGPKEVEAINFQDSNAISVPILKFKLSDSVCQTGYETFSHSSKIESNLKKEGFKKVSIKRTMWGSYPVLSFTGEKNGKFHAVAWIGLNDQSAAALCVNLSYPGSSGVASKEAIQLWDAFINNTKQLSHPEFFSALGQDLQLGYTIVDVVSDTATFVAEKRKRDNEIQLVVIPNGPDIKYTFEAMDEGLMGSQWNYKALLLKTYGNLTQTKNGARFNWLESVTSILLKSVDEFSISKKWIDSHPNVVAYQSKGAKI